MRSIVCCLTLGLTVLASCTTPEPEPEPQPPEVVFEVGQGMVTARDVNSRGLLDRRGQVHAHSVYSGDACDGEPVSEDGVRDQDCFDDFRAAVCQTRQDFIMLTDHRDAFDETEFPEALLYREDRGDRLVDHGAGPTANHLSCDGIAGAEGFSTLILGGNESFEQMPVGVEGHPVPREERGDLYGHRSPEHAQILRDAGAVILLAHPENWTAEELAAPELDGFEMFNLHRLFMTKLVYALDLAVRFSEGDPSLPVPDLAAVRLFEQDALYLSLWSQVAMMGEKKTMTFGTDCHQNTLPGDAGDGERIDSYRRMMGWMSNHLLVDAGDDGEIDDRDLKDALKAGRLYGAFEMYGSPAGFDFYAESTLGPVEMGGELSVADQPELIATLPDVDGLWERELPEVSLHLFKAADDGAWDEVSSATGAGGTLRHAVTEPGVYRVEAHIVPHHLEDELGGQAWFVLQEQHVWVMSNPIYVR